jgi:flagellar motility protein MotE (MotC chaperone)
MRFLVVSLIAISFVAVGQPEKTEIEREIERLKNLRVEIKKLIEKNNQILQKIKEEKEQLAKEKEELEKLKKEILDERYKKLAKVFEKMEPELAGEKISNMEDPKKAAYIIYNMKESKAGAVLDNVSPDMVNQIVKILTKLKKEEGKN